MPLLGHGGNAYLFFKMKTKNKVRFFGSNSSSDAIRQQAAGLAQLLTAYQEFRNAFLMIPEIQNAISNISGKPFSPYMAALKIKVRYISSEKYETNIVIQIDHLSCPLAAILLDVKDIRDLSSDISACEVQTQSNTMKNEFMQLAAYPKVAVSLARNPHPHIEMTSISWNSIMEMLERYAAINWSWIQMESFYDFLVSIQSADDDGSSEAISLAQA